MYLGDKHIAVLIDYWHIAFSASMSLVQFISVIPVWDNYQGIYTLPFEFSIIKTTLIDF